MLHSAPRLTSEDERVLAELETMREALRYRVAEPRRWSGHLRRSLIAHAIQGSNSIEGYQIGLDDAVAAVTGEDPMETSPGIWGVITGYRDVLTYVQQLGHSREFAWYHMLLNSLHFMMMRHELAKWPGRYRPGDIYVDESHTGRRVYTGPDADEVPSLVSELVDWLTGGESDSPLLVRASMAHLNLVKIHPWRDGNGRMSRCLHTLVLARDGVLAPEFSSIEEWLGAGRNTYAYYDVLAEVGGTSWRPANDTGPWIRFCLSAHHQQAQLVRQRLDQAARLWELLDDRVRQGGLPERVVSALQLAATGGRVRRTVYQRDEALTDDQAVRDLRALVRAGFLQQHGQTRGRYYVASGTLRELAAPARRPREIIDPYRC
ncbi:Adenosine monophosphate-protein transferase SoFic [Micromonospora sp. MW-13]|uniref:Fic family protein n=1 Tax=Micromonospora sp. MW-13 TaxID=2094022 RepID=UPI000EEFBC39|nr:Fic family protein [Micromonospora sp. MW-13]RGC68470.1 Adenosine monophosphate-protein transferase SoFic [Micromonospora sp. MW-13]